MNRIKSLLFQPTCAFCGDPVECYASLCPKCWLSIKFINRNVCKYCGEAINFEEQKKYDNKTSFQSCSRCESLLEYSSVKDNVLASIIYDDFSKPYILKFKHGNSIEYAALFAKFFHKNDFVDIDYIIPVPIHPFRLYKRTYNQTALLAFAIKKIHKDMPPILLGCLKKSKYTKSQKGRNFIERHNNISDSFFVNKKFIEKIKGKRVVIIDDVVASGATMLECKKVLQDAGAKEVRCIALAKTI